MVYEDKLLYCLDFLKDRTREEFEEIAAVQNPEIRKAMEKLYELSADEKVRAEYEMRQKARRDHMWMINSAREDGEAKGRQEGRHEGRHEGKAETARNLKLLGVSMDLIIKSTGLSQEEIAKL